jgi:hypothetical protein
MCWWAQDLMEHWLEESTSHSLALLPEFGKKDFAVSRSLYSVLCMGCG